MNNPSTMQPQLIKVFARNIQLEGFKKGWDSSRIAQELGISANSFRRLRAGTNRYICGDLLQSVMTLFNCTPNDLLLPHDGIDYSAFD